MTVRKPRPLWELLLIKRLVDRCGRGIERVGSRLRHLLNGSDTDDDDQREKHGIFNRRWAMFISSQASKAIDGSREHHKVLLMGSTETVQFGGGNGSVTNTERFACRLISI